MRRSAQHSCAACSSAFLPQARAEFYRWVDKDGKEFFSNDRKQVPPEYRDSAAVVKPDENRVSVSNKASRSGAGTSRSGRASTGTSTAGARSTGAGKRPISASSCGTSRTNMISSCKQTRGAGAATPTKEQRQKEKVHAGLEKKKMKLEKEIAQTTRMLEVDLPEEARKADAYPGWLRE